MLMLMKGQFLSDSEEDKFSRRSHWTCFVESYQKSPKGSSSGGEVGPVPRRRARKSPKGSRAGESSGPLRKKFAEKVQKEAEQASRLDFYGRNPQKKSKRKQSRRVVWTFTEEIRRKSPKGSNSGEESGPLRM